MAEGDILPGSAAFIAPAPEVKRWRYSFVNGRSLATFDGDIQFGSIIGGVIRTRLTVNTAVAVNYQTGSDAVSLSAFLAGSPARTFAVAFALLRDYVDTAGYTVTLTGTSSAPVTERLVALGYLVGQKYVNSFVIDYSTCDLVTVTGSSIANIGNMAQWKTKSISNASAEAAVQCYGGGDMWINPGEMKAATTGHFQAAQGSIRVTANYTISAAAPYHVVAEVGAGFFDFGGYTVTLTGVQNYTTAFANTGEGAGQIAIHSVVFNIAAATVTGKKFTVTDGGAISPRSKAMSLPGDVVGSWDEAQYEAGYLYGGITSNNVSDAANDIDFAAGTCVDSTNSLFMRWTSTITKRTDAAWAVGSGNGGLDTGAVGNATYHCFIIARDSDGLIDALFSLSPTAPTMPAGWTAKRRVASIIRAGGQVLSYTQTGDQFSLFISILDYNATPGATTAATLTLASVPTGIVVNPILGVQVTSGPTTNAGGLLSSLDVRDDAANSANAQSYINAANTNAAMTRVTDLRTDTSAQVRRRVQQTDMSLVVRTYGWVDTRGRLAA
ncbi:MAG: hypothetical protein IPK79_01400 [Vampirovibrionales bacterium]|nr:hypothetical protein [Vampirovibrionales bacterium]